VVVCSPQRLAARCRRKSGCTTPGTIWWLVLSSSMSAGLRLRERYQDWDRGPFTGESQDHISVYEVTAAPGG
jgi:hypothetical protein